MEQANQFNAFEMDILREIANIGAGHAATALAEMLSHQIPMEVPELRITPAEQLAGSFSSPEAEVVGILMDISGDIEGMLMYIIEKDFCHTLLQVLLNKSINSFSEVDEMDISALTEIGNIVAGAYVGALAEMTGLALRISPPSLALDMVGAILNYPAQLYGSMSDQVLSIEDRFGKEDEQVSCHLLIMPHPDSLNKMLSQLGVQYG